MVFGAIVIIVVGILVVNYFKEKGGTVPGISTEKEPTLKTYRVVKGDTLWSIAEKSYGSGFNWVDIAKENNLSNPNSIEIGQVLTIPDVPVKELTVKTTKSEEPISGATYEVVRGDNLWKIALRAYGDGYRWVDIAKENKLTNPNLIHAGNILILPR